MGAITEQKERSGSSLDSIKKFLGSKYQIDVAKQAGLLNRTLKKMRDDGVLVPGAQPGRKGSGSFKVSAEEKARIANAAKAAKKVKKTGSNQESCRYSQETYFQESAASCLGKEEESFQGIGICLWNSYLYKYIPRVLNIMVFLCREDHCQ